MFSTLVQCLVPRPSKILEVAIEQWKIMDHQNKMHQQNASPKPTIEQFDKICKQTKACNKVAEFIGMLSSRFYTD